MKLSDTKLVLGLVLLAGCGGSQAAPTAPCPACAAAATAASAPPTAAPTASPTAPAAVAPVACTNNAPDKTVRGLPGALARMEYFVGSWTCAGQAEKTHLWDAHPTSSTMTIEHDMNNFWLGLRMAENEAPESATPLRSSGWWGYDAGSNRLVRIFATNFGGWGVGYAPGWAGDQLVWTGDIDQGNKQKLGFRHTITKVDANTFKEKFEVNDQGNWVLRGGSTCRKS